ncbi:tripartite tricarboxylate transporter TctB family protein [Pseudotabrizicola formosa]|uniref:tripartite tricarboxylate transporter TctB family protein n=1 Tax=Pseudotabrizicola formosa TaxID=2030009 RepID=UPI000CD1BFF0|nr:tripartite tricarboxylate transporter TctB family protein [Pseudotabrizicola formosa]
MRVTDALSGAIFLAVGLFVFQTAAGFPNPGGMPHGASLLPSLLGLGLMIGGGLLVISDILARRTAKITPSVLSLDPELKTARGLLPVAMVMVLILGQILLAGTFGYLAVSIVGLTLLFLTVRLSALSSLGLAIAGSLLCWWLFAGLLRVPLPRGLLEGVL